MFSMVIEMRNIMYKIGNKTGNKQVKLAYRNNASIYGGLRKRRVNSEFFLMYIFPYSD